MSEQGFNIKITFEENDKHAATVLFTLVQNPGRADVDIVLDCKADNLAASLAKYLSRCINDRLHTLGNVRPQPTAKA